MPLSLLLSPFITYNLPEWIGTTVLLTSFAAVLVLPIWCFSVLKPWSDLRVAGYITFAVLIVPLVIAILFPSIHS